MSKTTQRPSIKQQALINAARKLFVAHGIRRVTVEEICRTANASKMTFYRFYNNKDAIAMAVIDQIADRMMERMETIMEQDMPFGEKAKAMIAARAETTDQFSTPFFKDLLDDTSPAGIHLLKRRAENLKRIQELLRAEQDNGAIRSDINIGFIVIMAEYFTVFMKDERMQRLFPTHAEHTKAINDFYLYGIIGKTSGEQNENRTLL